MDVNIVLLTFAGVYTTITFWRAWTASKVADTGNWMAVCAIVLAVLVVSIIVIPDVSGYVTGIVWALLLVIPAVGLRYAQTLIMQQRYEQARCLIRFVRLLHPVPGAQGEPEFYRALGLAQRGALSEALDVLKRQASSDTPLGRAARQQIHRLLGQWEELRTWLGQNLDDPSFQRDANAIGMYIRALGETGEINGMVYALDRFHENLGRARALNMAYLFAFAFCGRRDQVEKLFHGPLRLYNPALQSYWLGVADLAAGRQEDAQREFALASKSSDAVVRDAVQRRLSQPLARPADVLLPAPRRILEQSERDLDHEIRFGYRGTAGHGRAIFTYLLIALNLVAFGLEVALGGSTNIETLYRMGALVPESALAGEWWRLLTAMFLHYGFAHLFMNMLALWVLGPFVEYALGARRFMAVYFVSGLGGMAGVVLLRQAGLLDEQILVGASGAIMGLIGATGAVMLRGWRTEQAVLARRRLVAVLVIIGLQTALDALAVMQTSLPAHLGGAVIGFVLTSLLEHRTSRPAAADSPQTVDG